jgi:hypothetical protein
VNRATFRGIAPRAWVIYRTPQGAEATARAQPLLCFSSHVVCDRGNGQPVVVDPYNYVSHINPKESGK